MYIICFDRRICMHFPKPAKLSYQHQHLPHFVARNTLLLFVSSTFVFNCQRNTNDQSQHPFSCTMTIAFDNKAIWKPNSSIGIGVPIQRQIPIGTSSPVSCFYCFLTNAFAGTTRLKTKAVAAACAADATISLRSLCEALNAEEVRAHEGTDTMWIGLHCIKKWATQTSFSESFYAKFSAARVSARRFY